MPAITFKPRVKETSTTTGTGNITLAGAVVGYQSFDDAFTVTDDYFYYCIEGVDGSGVPTGQWEEGIGHLSASTTLVRDTLLASSTGSAVSFSAGTKNVFCTVAAKELSDGVIRLLNSVTIATDTGTKQTLYTVPTGKKCIVTHCVVRSASADLSSMGDVWTLGFGTFADEWGIIVTTGMFTASTQYQVVLPISSRETGYANNTIGSAADVFGTYLNDPSIAGTCVIDVFGYLYNA